MLVSAVSSWRGLPVSNSFHGADKTLATGLLTIQGDICDDATASWAHKSHFNHKKRP